MPPTLAPSGHVACFAVAYLANRVTSVRPVEPTVLMQPATFKRPIVVIEAHGRDEHLRAECEIVELKARQPTLGALSTPEPAMNSLYAALLSMRNTARSVPPVVSRAKTL